MISEDKEEFMMLFLHCLPESPRSNKEGRTELCEGLHMQTEL